MKARVIIKLIGRVQGMGFRSMVKIKALSLSLTGYVKNLNGDAVEIAAEGEKENLTKLLQWIHSMPAGIQINKLEDYWHPFENKFSDFVIQS